MRNPTLEPRTKILMMLIAGCLVILLDSRDGTPRLFPREPHTDCPIRADVATDWTPLYLPLFHNMGFSLQSSDLL